MLSTNNHFSIISLLLRYKKGCNLSEANIRLFEYAKTEVDLLDMFADSDVVWAENALAEHQNSGIHVISIIDPLYPYLLKQIPDPPSILFLRGPLDILLELNSVSVVGAREATANGKIIAKRISSFLSKSGWCITSGLALGIDAAAHEGALEAGGITIAVLAHGLEKATPKQNEQLALNILENGGAWLSEHPIGTSVRKENFIGRNRLQIGISAGSIIIEAGLKSGSATQARFCRAQNRPLFAVVPESPENPLGLFSEGTQEFVKFNDAFPVRSKRDYGYLMFTLEKSMSRLKSLGG